jgi:hypothetical protein
MHKRIREYLATIDWHDGDPPPVVDLDLYFDGNDEEESIAPNEWGSGRPPIATLFARFKEIAAMPNVQSVVVGLHFDWNDPLYIDGFPPAENVHIITSAAEPEVERWLVGMCCDGVIPGWPYGRPANAPRLGPGMNVFSVCWD